MMGDLDYDEFYKERIRLAIEINKGYTYFTYSSLLKADAMMSRMGCDPVSAHWNCPVCKVRWRDCNHTMFEVFPRWEDRPWR